MSRSILIVDDEAPIRALLRQTLEDIEAEGVELLEATNGNAAIALARAHRPALVLLDVMMPGMNGYEVCETLKGDKALRDTPIVMLTARGQAFDRVHGEMAGADVYLTKPFDPMEVAALVRQLLKLP